MHRGNRKKKKNHFQPIKKVKKSFFSKKINKKIILLAEMSSLLAITL